MTTRSGLKSLPRHIPGAGGPVAIVLSDFPQALLSTLEHYLGAGFETVILFEPKPTQLPRGMANRVQQVAFDVTAPNAFQAAVNAIMPLVEHRWICAVWSGEYLFWPYKPDRTVADLTEFAQSERRRSIAGTVVDLYSADAKPPSFGGPCWLDADCYASTSPDEEIGETVTGGLRLRYADHVPARFRRIDRPMLFRAAPRLCLQDDFQFNVPEYNTRSCPWHRNPTVALCSFRAERALRYRIPHIEDFRWSGSEAFSWRQEQLSDLGFIEPGQWV